MLTITQVINTRKHYRQGKYFKDTMKISTYLAHKNPFSSTQGESLQSIFSGVVVGPNVNVDKANETGKGIVKMLEGKDVEKRRTKP